MKYLIDSDYVADYLKGRNPSTTLLDTLFPESLAISIVTFAEVKEKALEKSKIREVFFFSVCYTDQVTSMRTLVRWGSSIYSIIEQRI